MKLKYNFTLNEVADRIVAVAMGDDLQKFGGFIKMNKTGAYIFEMLKNDVTKEDIVSAMMKDFVGATKEEITETVDEFITSLQNSGVIE